MTAITKKDVSVTAVPNQFLRFMMSQNDVIGRENDANGWRHLRVWICTRRCRLNARSLLYRWNHLNLLHCSHLWIWNEWILIIENHQGRYLRKSCLINLIDYIFGVDIFIFPPRIYLSCNCHSFTQRRLFLIPPKTYITILVADRSIFTAVISEDDHLLFLSLAVTLLIARGKYWNIAGNRENERLAIAAGAGGLESRETIWIKAVRCTTAVRGVGLLDRAQLCYHSR